MAWLAPVATMVAAMMTAANLGARVTGYGFVVFAIGSIAWVLIGASSGQLNLLASNIFLTFVNLIGIWRWLGRQARYEDGAAAAAIKSRRAAVPTLFTATGVAGMRVMDRLGDDLGYAVEALVECRSGTISYVVVTCGTVPKVREVLRAVSFADLDVTGDRLVFTGRREIFDALPTLSGDDWPEAPQTSPAF